MDALNEISKNTERIVDLVGYVDGVVAKKAEELTNLDDAISKRKESLAKLDSEYEERRQSHARDMELFANDAEDAVKKLDAVKEEIARITADRDKVKKEHANFVSYHITAEKALQAKESSLIERERSLEETVNELKRRRGILGI